MLETSHIGKTGSACRGILLVIFTGLFGVGAQAGDSQSTAFDPAQVGLSAHRLDHIDALARRYVDQGRLPGVVYAVARRGQLARLGRVGPLQPDSIFRIYSMTKPVTAVAVLMLYEEGKLLLTDPVSRYLPEFSSMRVYDGVGDDGEPITHKAKTPITIEDLLTHTAGLTYDDASGAGVAALYARADLWSARSLSAFTRKVAALPLVFEPGTGWRYSVAFDILGRLVEVVAGQPFDKFMQTRILNPLQMEDTSFAIPDNKLKRLAPLYSRQGKGMKLAEKSSDNEFRDPDAVPYGGGGLVSTASDYLRFCQMLLNDGRLGKARILGRKTVELMMMDHLGHGDARLRINDSWVGNTENRSSDMQLGLGFGFGGYVISDVAANDVPGSVGTYAWGGAASTYFFIDRKEQLIGIFLTQLMPSDSYPLRAQFRGLVYQAIVD